MPTPTPTTKKHENVKKNFKEKILFAVGVGGYWCRRRFLRLKTSSPQVVNVSKPEYITNDNWIYSACFGLKSKPNSGFWQHGSYFSIRIITLRGKPWCHPLKSKKKLLTKSLTLVFLGETNYSIHRKKVKLLIWLFDLCWETRFSIFSLGTFEKVGPFLGLDGTSDEIKTKNIFHISGSIETMQNALAAVV